MSLRTSPNGLDMFRELPSELKCMILGFAVADDGYDIHVALKDENGIAESDTKLICPALDLLSAVKEVSLTTYGDMIANLAGSAFRWVFFSKTQPHRFVLRAFREQAPVELQSQIQCVYMPQFTLKGYYPDSGFPTPSHLTETTPMYAYDQLNSAYFTSLEKIFKCFNGEFLTKIRKDINCGIHLLRCIFSAIKRLDMSLDIMECLPCSTISESISTMRHWKLFKLNYTRASPFEHLCTLMSVPHIGKINIRIFWDNFFQPGRDLRQPYEEQDEEEAKCLYIEALQYRIPAKSITGHEKN